MTTTRLDTGRAKLPALPALNASDPKSVAAWAKSVAERIEVREGARGNPAERAVTVRELQDVKAEVEKAAITSLSNLPAGAVPIKLGGGGWGSLEIEQFANFIRNTRLYRDLMKRLDDPTRFNDIVEPVRNILLKNIADEALLRGADIRRLETRLQTSEQSLSMAVTELTAAIGAQSAGLRQTQFAYADQFRAQAGQITQLESSLGNYYQDGTPGRASLEEALFTSADLVDGLRAQYTLKVQAGGALAGFGIAATEVNGEPSSAFIIAADKFAIVSPSYTGGLTTTPNVNNVPFGVDANGIYMNTNVYLKGSMKVDSGGGTLKDGLRGSMSNSYTASAWSDGTASQVVWTALGKPGSPPNTNHLVIGDAVTRSNGADPPDTETRYWNDAGWVAQGVFLNGNLLVNGSVAATKINTRGLDIKDAAGNIIFSSGINLDYSRVEGGPPATATANRFYQQATAPTGATINDIWFNTSNASTYFFNGSTWIKAGDVTGSNTAAAIAGQGNFATTNQITSGNISSLMGPNAISTTYIADLAVSNAKIASLAVSSAKIADLAVTNAKIADLAVSNAKIDNLAVTTAKLGNNAVSVMNSASGTGSASTSLSIPAGVTAQVFAVAYRSSFAGGASAGNGTLSVSGAASGSVSVRSTIDGSTYRYPSATVAALGSVTGPANATVSASWSATNDGAPFASVTLTAFAAWK